MTTPIDREPNCLSVRSHKEIAAPSGIETSKRKYHLNRAFGLALWVTSLKTYPVLQSSPHHATLCIRSKGSEPTTSKSVRALLNQRFQFLIGLLHHAPQFPQHFALAALPPAYRGPRLAVCCFWAG